MLGDSDEEYQSYGCFDPFEAKRLLKRFEEEGVRFQISDASGPAFGRGDTQLRRREDSIEIFIHPKDSDAAGKVMSEDWKPWLSSNMLFLTLIRLLRDMLGLIAAIGVMFTGFLARSEFVMYSMQTDWRLGNENQIMLLFFAATSTTAGIAWCFVQQREWAVTDRRNVKSRQCGHLISN
jgi:hypothetical protein